MVVTAAVVAAVAVGSQPAAAIPAGLTAQLPIHGYQEMVLDEAHGHLIILDQAQLLVTDLRGKKLASVAEPYPTHLALSPDSGTVYVSVLGDNGQSSTIKAFDTGTFALKKTYDLYDGNTVPAELAVTGGQLFFSYRNIRSGPPGHSSTGVGSFDLADPAPVPRMAKHWVQLDVAPHIAASPAAPGVLLVGQAQVADYRRSVELDRYVVGPGVFTRTAALPADKAPLSDFGFSADGGQVVAATPWPDRYGGDLVLKSSDLSTVGNFDHSWTGGGEHLATGPGLVAESNPDGEVDVYTLGAFGDVLPLHRYLYGVDASMGHGIAFSHDGSRLYAITHDVDRDTYALHVEENPGLPQVYVFLDSRLPVPLGQPFAMTGQAKSAKPLPTSVTVRITRDGKPLTDVQVGADGRYSFTDQPSATGKHVYRASYAGDAGHVGSEAEIAVTVTDAPAGSGSPSSGTTSTTTNAGTSAAADTTFESAPGQELAATGGGGEAGMLAGAGAALVAVGGAVLLLLRRRPVGR